MTRLEQLRLDAGLTPEQLAELIGFDVSARTIRRIESGSGARVSKVTRLAQHFDVPVSDLRRPALPVSERAA